MFVKCGKAIFLHIEHLQFNERQGGKNVKTKFVRN